MGALPASLHPTRRTRFRRPAPPRSHVPPGCDADTGEVPMNGSTMTGATAELCDLAGLRERRDVLDRVSADAARARAGTGRVVLVCGPTGTGRSALLEAVAARESRRGMRVLRARCSPEDSRAEFAAVAELLDADLRPPPLTGRPGTSREPGRTTPCTEPDGPPGSGGCCAPTRPRDHCCSWWTTCTWPTRPRAAGSSGPPGCSTAYPFCWSSPSAPSTTWTRHRRACCAPCRPHCSASTRSPR